MKTLIFAFLTLFTLNFAAAQECADGWLPFAEGTNYEHTHYNSKGKVESISSAEVSHITTAEYGTRAEVKINSADKKGKNSLPEMSIYYTCTGDAYEADMSDFFNSVTGTLPQEVEIKMSSIKLVFPKNMKVGDELTEADAEFSATMMGMKLMSGKVSQTNRKVIAEEKITVPAGSFDCLKITETITSDFSIRKVEFETTTWIAKGVGMVRQEMRNGDKLDNYMELTKFAK